MNAVTRWLDDALYPGTRSNWDDRLLRERILATLRPTDHVLDLGAGAGIIPEMHFRGLAARVAGIDLDERVLQNPMLDEARLATAESIPYPDEAFDLVFCDNVMEHLANPERVLREIRRVLKPGGLFIGKTPNRLHYMPQIARLTPHWFHQLYNRLRGRAAADTFPTLYRMNTPRALRDLAGRVGLRVERIDLVENRPEYLRVTPLTYLAGYVYERLVNATPLLAPFRILLIAELRK